MTPLAVVLALLAATGGSALGQATFVGHGTDNMNGNAPLNASVTFSITNGTQLQISLSNLGPPLTGSGALQPSDILTALYFATSNFVGTLTPVSALTVGTEYNFPASGAGSNVGDGWDYATGLSGPRRGDRGLSAAGFSGFGAANMDPAHPANEQTNSVNGFDYGIVDQSPSNGNGHVPTTPLEGSTVVFLLSGLPLNYNLGNIGSVTFQYGTGAGEPNFPGTLVIIPEPSTFVLVGLAIFAGASLRRLRRSGLALIFFHFFTHSGSPVAITRNVGPERRK